MKCASKPILNKFGPRTSLDGQLEYETVNIGRFEVPKPTLVQKAVEFSINNQVLINPFDLHAIYASLKSLEEWNDIELEMLAELFETGNEALNIADVEANRSDVKRARDAAMPYDHFALPQSNNPSDIPNRYDWPAIRRSSCLRFLLKFLSINPDKNLSLVTEYEEALQSSKFSDAFSKMGDVYDILSNITEDSEVENIYTKLKSDVVSCEIGLALNNIRHCILR